MMFFKYSNSGLFLHSADTLPTFSLATDSTADYHMALSLSDDSGESRDRLQGLGFGR